MKTLVYPLLIIILSVTSCTTPDVKEQSPLKGTWTLESVQSHDGTVHHYTESDVDWLRIYDDTCFYECQIINAPNGKLIIPNGYQSYTLIDRGLGDYVYLQGHNTNPLTVVNDTSIVIQEHGIRYTWKTCKAFDAMRISQIVDIIRHDVHDEDAAAHRYIFSDTERQLQTTNHTLVYFIIVIVVVLLLLANYARQLRQHKLRVEHELRQIEQERKAMPEQVRQAIDTVEQDFRQSDFYLALRKKIALGQRLDKDDWSDIEDRFKSVYPRFSSTLLTLHHMSEVEYKVCLLLKLNASPTEIAAVLCKDTSSISSTRSRLYLKVFGKKGSSKDWDEFIRSL